MATIDSASHWSDGASGCRNQRAPRIGEIQRHKAVEMERSTTTSSSSGSTSTNSSNNSSTNKSPTTTTPTNPAATNPFIPRASTNNGSSNNTTNRETTKTKEDNDDQNKESPVPRQETSSESVQDASGQAKRKFKELELCERNNGSGDTKGISAIDASKKITESTGTAEGIASINHEPSVKTIHYPAAIITTTTTTTSTNKYAPRISKCLSQSSSTTTISSSASSSPMLIDSPSSGPFVMSPSSSNQPIEPPPIHHHHHHHYHQKNHHKRSVLPKTQSLDLARDDDTNDADIEDDEDSSEGPGGIQRQPTVIQRPQGRAIVQTQSQSDIPAPAPTPTESPIKGTISKLQSMESRPIYPNVPYSPYGSPFASPKSCRRRAPLKESRRISIEQSGSFLQLNQYKLMDQIGQGSYGLVKLAYSEEDSTHYAMKILSKRKLVRKAGLIGRGPKKTTSPLDRVYREIAVLKKLDHPNVVKLTEVLDDPLEDFLYLVFELVQQGEVLSIPTDRPLSEERAWSVFRDALLGLEYLHYQRIIHSDIKPGNLLLAECGRVKIADLGVCNEFLGEDATMNNGSTAGTPAFRAPETLIPGQQLYSGKAIDIWALGVTLYSIIYGNVPFIATSVPAVYEKIKNDELKFPDFPAASEDLRDLIEKLLTKDPSNRITLPKIKMHKWVTADGKHPLPSEDENCRLVQISDEDINSVVKSIPKLDTLILIKTMLKNHSFQNPFTRSTSGRAPQRGGSRIERFTRAGRSNSAPGAYHTDGRQLSTDSILPAVSETVPSSFNESSDQSFDDIV